MDSVKVNPKDIPEIEIRMLCVTFLEAALRFYENPANQAGYEAWLAGRKGGKANGQKDGSAVEAGLPNPSAG